MPMVRYIPDPANPARMTAEEAAHRAAMTDEELTAAALSDPDNPPLTDAQLDRMEATFKLRRIRAKTGLTQEEFAAAIGAPVATLRNWEQGRHAPDAVAQTVYRAIDRDPAGALAMLRAAE